MVRIASTLFVLTIGLFNASVVHAQTRVLRVVPQSSLIILDPVWTTSYVTRNHGYMIYDTLFAVDENGVVKPQMVETYDVHSEGKVWTFRLRTGLRFHDGSAVTAVDCIASLQRWATRDAMGAKLASFVDKWEVVDALTFRMTLKEPFGLVLDSLGKPSSNVPFIMPKRFADTPSHQQIGPAGQIGSGPFIFEQTEYKPGAVVVYGKFADYQPRNEPPSGLAGGKHALVDRVEWIILKDAQTQFNALVKGEVDIVERPAFEQVEALSREKDIELINSDPGGNLFTLRFNHLVPPFDNPAIRRAAMLSLNQEAFLRTQVGSGKFQGRRLWRTCASMYPCGSRYASESPGFNFTTYDERKVMQARRLLRASGYDGRAIVILRQSDIASTSKLALVATQLLRNVGFVVDVQSMDSQSQMARLAKTAPVEQGGWNIYLASQVAANAENPLSNPLLQATGIRGWTGWPEDAMLEALRDRFARETDDVKKIPIAEAIQLRAFQVGTQVPLGESIVPTAVRKGIRGLIKAPVQVYWNVTK